MPDGMPFPFLLAGEAHRLFDCNVLIQINIIEQSMPN